MTPASQQAQPQAQSAHTPSASASTDSPSNPEELSWEGDKMFNIYIWDYCVKRGYKNTARELAEEAKLNPNPRPPIDAKQGLLYEWWSVFWLLFSAKSNNQGSEDALYYIQNHSRMHQMPGVVPRYANGIRALPGGPGAIPMVPNSLGAGAPQHSGHPSQTQNAHPMPNGIGPNVPGQQQTGQPQGLPQQQGQGQQHPPQAPPPLGFPHVQQQQPQSNGVPTHARPPMSGQPARPFYHSPTIPNQQAGGASGPPPPYPGSGPVGGAGIPPHMYAQPHMARNMLPPPGTPNGIGGGVAGSPGFSQSNVGTGSRAPTPGGSNMTQPSPNMTHRSVPPTPPHFGGAMTVPGGRGPLFDQLNADIQKIDPTTMNELRQELGLASRDPLALSMDDKHRLVAAFKQRNAPGPSNPARPQQGRGAKRNSVSPGDEHADIPAKDEASPPAQKRVRRSPDRAAPPILGPTGPTLPPSAGASAGGMYPPTAVPNGMRPGGQPFTQISALGQLPTPGMMLPPGPHQGIPNQQLPQFQKNQSQTYHTNLPPGHKMNTADVQQQLQQPQFGGDPSQGRPAPPPFGGQRPNMNQSKMPPPSSPATSTNTNGQGKAGQNLQGKAEGGKTDSSPRSGPPPPPSGSAGRSPPTPAPAQVVATPSPSLSSQSRPTTSTSNPPTGGTSSQTPVQNAPPPPPSAPLAAPSAESMNFDFMTSGFDDFASMFGREDSNFSDDFGIGWFGTTDITGMTDSLK